MLNQGFRLWGFQKIIGGTASSGKVQLGLLGPRNTKCPATEQKKTQPTSSTIMFPSKPRPFAVSTSFWDIKYTMKINEYFWVLELHIGSAGSQ
jgi:hypothetical protein